MEPTELNDIAWWLDAHRFLRVNNTFRDAEQSELAHCSYLNFIYVETYKTLSMCIYARKRKYKCTLSDRLWFHTKSSYSFRQKRSISNIPHDVQSLFLARTWSYYFTLRSLCCLIRNNFVLLISAINALLSVFDNLKLSCRKSLLRHFLSYISKKLHFCDLWRALYLNQIQIVLSTVTTVTWKQWLV